MTLMTKALTGAIAAGAMAMAATPVAAQSYRDRNDDGIDAGEIIAGALILGGIAAVAGSVGNRDRYDYRDSRYNYRNGRYRNTGRSAVDQCVRAVESQARRAGYRYADVTEIEDVDDKRRGWRVKGRVVVDGQSGYGYSDRYNSRYDSRYDRRYDRRYRGDSGKFSCDVQYGRVVDIDFKSIRGLR